MNFFKNVLQRRSFILFLTLFFCVIGILKFTQMPRSLFPEVNYPRVVVDVYMGYSPLQVMEWTVTAPLEKELRTVPGVRLIKSNSSRGMASVDVYLNEKEDISSAIQRVSSKISEVRSQLPANAQISVRPITAAAFPAAEYCFTSPKYSTQELRTLIDYTIKPAVMSVSGVFNTAVLGGDQPEYSVALDEKKMAQNNITVFDVTDRLKNSNQVDFLGPVNTNGQQLLSFGGRYMHSTEDIANTIVDNTLGHPVRIADIGRVNLQNQWKTQSLSLNGIECVGMDIFYQAGIDQKITSSEVKNTIKSFVEKDPNLSYKSWDLNDFTDSATNAVLLDLAVGMLIIGLVTFVFLRDFKSSLIALLCMPLAASLTFLIMSRLGLSINLMTLGGLTAAIGLVVDNTVIVLEMFHTKKEEAPNESNARLMIETLSASAKPMIMGTLTIALVFTPISYLSGISGMFFSPMADVHGTSLLVSVLIALFTVPGIVIFFESFFQKSKTTHPHKPKSNFISTYRKYLDYFLNLKPKAAMLLFIIPLFGIISLFFSQTGFLPEWDEGDIVVDFRAIQPISLKSTEEKIKPLEKYLASIPEVNFFIRKAGTNMGQLNSSPFSGEIVVRLKKKRTRSVFEIKDLISQKVDSLAPDFEFDLFQILPDRLNDLSGSGKPIALHIYGEDNEILDKAAQDFKTSISQIKGLDSVRIEEPEKSTEILYNINEARSRAINLNPSDLNSMLQFELFSVDVTHIQNGSQSIPVRLRSLTQSENQNLNDISIFSPKGGIEKASQIGAVQNVLSRTESNHINGRLVRTVTAEISGRDLGSVVRDVQKIIASKKDNKSISVELKGDYELQKKSFTELIMAFLAGLVLILMMSILFLNRPHLALVLTLCSLIPPIFGLMGCVIFRIPLDVSSFSGLISVTGITVANSFMAIAAIEAQSFNIEDLHNSILNGMSSRIRPILMTNLAAMAGFIPIAIGLATGDEILRPFSIAIIIGLFGAMYTSLFLVPIFYKMTLKKTLSNAESL